MRKAMTLWGLSVSTLFLLAGNPAASPGDHIPRSVTCDALLAAGVPDAYAAGLLDGVRALEIAFRTDVYRLRRDGENELAARSGFVAEALAERLRHAEGKSARQLAQSIRASCADDLDGTAELHFVLALDNWRRGQPL